MTSWTETERAELLRAYAIGILRACYFGKRVEGTERTAGWRRLHSLIVPVRLAASSWVRATRCACAISMRRKPSRTTAPACGRRALVAYPPSA
jgi:hypothetical protein